MNAQAKTWCKQVVTQARELVVSGALQNRREIARMILELNHMLTETTERKK